MSVPAPLEIQHLEFRLKKKLQVVNEFSNALHRHNLIASASNYGLVFVGGESNELKVLRLTDIVNSNAGDSLPFRTVTLSGPPMAIAVNCDSSLLAINYISNNSSLLDIYNVASFYSHNVVKVIEHLQVSSIQNAGAKLILWNPVIDRNFAILTTDGQLSAYTIRPDNGLEFHSNQSPEVVCSACWSPKGKQIVAGLTNGKLIQYKPDLKPAKTIQCPPVKYGATYRIVALQWLSTHQFAAVFMKDGEDAFPALHIINAPKGGNPVCIDYDDICYSQPGPRCNQVFLTYVQPWNILVMATGSAIELGVLGTDDTSDLPTWKQYILDGSVRAEMPLDGQDQETYPMGISLDTGSTHELIVRESKQKPMPMIHLISDRGVLISYDFLNTLPNIPGICSPPKTVADTSGIAQFSIPPALSSVTTPPVSQSVEKPNPQPIADFTFGSLAATSTPAVRKTQPVQNLFGNNEPPKLEESKNISAVLNTPNENKLGFGLAQRPVQMGMTFGTPIIKENDKQPINFGKPVQQPTPPVVQVPAERTVQLEPAKPLITVGNTYNHPHDTGNTAVKETGGQFSSESEKNAVIKKLINDEINLFNAELEEMAMKAKSITINIGSEDEKKRLTSQINQLNDLNDQAIESTESLNQDIQALRITLNEAFAMAAEASGKQSSIKNPNFVQLQEFGSLSQTSRRQITRLQNMLAVNEAQYQIAMRQIDAQWSSFQEISRQNECSRMHIPSLEGVYQTLTQQREILNKFRAKINYIKAHLGIKDLKKSTRNSNIVKSNNESSYNVESLADSILSLSMADQVKTKCSKLSPDVWQTLRNTLKGRQVTVIKPTRPNRKDLNSEIIIERKCEEMKAQEKQKQAAKAAVLLEKDKKLKEEVNKSKMNPKSQLNAESKPFQMQNVLAASQSRAQGNIMGPKELTTTTVPMPQGIGLVSRVPVSIVTGFGAPASVDSQSIFQKSSSTFDPPVSTPWTVKSMTSASNPSVSSSTASGIGLQVNLAKPSVPKQTITPVNYTATPPNVNIATLQMNVAKPAVPNDLILMPQKDKENVNVNRSKETVKPDSNIKLDTPSFMTSDLSKNIVSPFGSNTTVTSQPSVPVTTVTFSFNIPKSSDSFNSNQLFSSTKFATALNSATSPNTQAPVSTTSSVSASFQFSIPPKTEVKSDVTVTIPKPVDQGIFNKSGETPSFGFGVKPATTVVAGTTVSTVSNVTGIFASALSTGNIAPSPAVPEKTEEILDGLSICKPNVSESKSAASTKGFFGEGFGSSTNPITTESSGGSIFGNKTSAFGTNNTAPTTTSASIFGGFAQTKPTSTTGTTGSAFGSLFGANLKINDSAPVVTSTATSTNIFGAPVSTPTSTTNIFGATVSTPTSSTNIFGKPLNEPPKAFGATPTITSAPAISTTTNIFGQSTTGSSSFNSFSFGQAVATTAPTTSIFAAAVSSTAPTATQQSSVFGGSSVFGAKPASDASQKGFGFNTTPAPAAAAAATATANTSSGGSLFGSSSFTANNSASNTSVFGGTPNNSFGQSGTSIFGNQANQNQSFGSSAFGAVQPNQNSSFGNTSGNLFASAQSPGTGQSGFGTTNTGSFGSGSVFGQTATFGGGASFGSPQPSFGAPPVLGGGKIFGSPQQSTMSPPTQKNNLFESLGANNTGISFGNLAQPSNNEQKPQFGGSAFSSWR